MLIPHFRNTPIVYTNYVRKNFTNLWWKWINKKIIFFSATLISITIHTKYNENIITAWILILFSPIFTQRNNVVYIHYTYHIHKVWVYVLMKERYSHKTCLAILWIVDFDLVSSLNFFGRKSLLNFIWPIC